jgi:hypothetical protein
MTRPRGSRNRLGDDPGEIAGGALELVDAAKAAAVEHGEARVGGHELKAATLADGDADITVGDRDHQGGWL